jgi:hypothetical protein
MSNQMKRALAKLSVSMCENLPHVKQRLSEAGVSSHNALIYSVAKYYTALNKLAEEK